MKKMNLKENQKLIIMGVFLFITMLGIVGYTYSFFQTQDKDTGTITGTVASVSLSLEINKLAPDITDEGLIPQLDEYITSAVVGKNNKNCVDDNNNIVCQVYEAIVTNNSSVSIQVDGLLELNAGNNPNLKWSIIDSYEDGMTTNPNLVGEIKTHEEKVMTSNETYNANETKNYYIVIWISETDDAQTDTGIFTGTITFKDHEANVAEPNSNMVNINSTNATATFDYVRKRVLISNTSATGAITFSLTETPIARTYFSDYIISLLGTNTSVASESTTGNGSTLEIVNSPLPDGTNTSTDYRYRGVNPANYVMFNDELWRIIGVFDSNSHNVKNENDESINLVKIIRNDSIGSYVWDNANGNNYVNSDIYQILNTAYYNHIDGTGQDYCYAYGTFETGKCDFTKIGIQEEYQRMSEDNVTWYLGGNGSGVSAPDFYKYERTNTNKYTDNDAITTTTTSIGLMYASDYGYAAPSACTNTSTSSFNSTNSTLGTLCGAQSWLNSNHNEWTITHITSDSSHVFYVDHVGNLGSYNKANHSYATRPVLYLESSVYYLSGTGTQIDPYIIAMD